MKTRLSSIIQFFSHIPLVLRYGLLLCVGLITLKTIEFELFSFRYNLEIYSFLIAGFFMLIGISASIGWLHLQDKKKKSKQEKRFPLEPLTIKEKNLLEGLKDGLSNQQLADKHYLSINTVKSHLKSLYRKLDVSSRLEAVERSKSPFFHP